MNIGIIDAEIVGKSKHRFPNLCSMKISAWHKAKGDNVTLLLSYDNISNSKYKRDIEGYLQDGGKKNKTWIALEEFCRTHKELCEKYFNLPIDRPSSIV